MSDLRWDRMTREERRAWAAEWAERTAVAQGLPPIDTDPVKAARIAVLIRAARKQQQSA